MEVAETVQTNNQVSSQQLVGIRFQESGKVYHFDGSALSDLKPGDHVIVETTRGRQVGEVASSSDIPAPDDNRSYKPVIRIATPQDLVSAQVWQAKEDEALALCRSKAEDLGGLGNVKFVKATYNYDGSLLTVLYSAEDKAETNKLRSVMRRTLRTKVEIRQIGPRDVAKALAGYGACGELRCCSTFLTEFSPISIKMAKAQGISLNPSEITGMCGRLRCCLLYEYEEYVHARKSLPKKGKRVGTPFGEGKVINLMPLQDSVVVIVDDVRHVVTREDLIPLDELEALKKGGCGGGACGCR